MYNSTDMTHNLTLLPQDLLNVHHSWQPQGLKTCAQQPRQNIESVVYEIFSRNIQHSCPIIFFSINAENRIRIYYMELRFSNGLAALCISRWHPSFSFFFSFQFLSLQVIHLLIFPDLLYFYLLANTTKTLSWWAMNSVKVTQGYYSLRRWASEMVMVRS